jgi:hypothetical protein
MCRHQNESYWLAFDFFQMNTNWIYYLKVLLVEARTISPLVPGYLNAREKNPTVNEPRIYLIHFVIKNI